jgi:putative ATP-dependent endonuclease of OLD family
MPQHSCLIRMRIMNLGCIGPQGIDIELDDIICLVGPNNCGKSTVLRAYEAAVGNLDLTAEEICLHAAGASASVEIWVHIPEGVENIDEKWKTVEGEYRLVRSKWEWAQPGKPIRRTWDPALNEYAENEKASGIDAVFSSRLPQPLRIQALQSPTGEHDVLLKLILDPIVKQLALLLCQAESDLKKAVQAVTAAARTPVAEFSEKLKAVKDKVNKSYQRTFPNSEIDLAVDVADVELKPIDLLSKGSRFEVLENGAKASWRQQGTGSQRALFWSMLEARSELKKAADQSQLIERRLKEIAKATDKLLGEIAKAKRAETKATKEVELKKLQDEQKILMDPKGAEALPDNVLKLPGYMLLIDEPEIALHPNAVRAAKSHLFDLARESGWQVMLSTHSPAFIDPLENHTSIVRLVRTDAHPTPKTYRSDNVKFSNEERENLKMLLQFDHALAEMFFGAYPIIVEGDTEFAAFTKVMDTNIAEYPYESRPLLIRARGKEIVPTIIRILTQFKVAFAVLHDSDSPRTKSGKRGNSAWSANDRISQALGDARAKGLHAVHRISIPDFERAQGLPEGSSNKPFAIWKAMSKRPETASRIRTVFDELNSPDGDQHAYPLPLIDGLIEAVKLWANKSATDEPRFNFAPLPISDPDEEEVGSA